MLVDRAILSLKIQKQYKLYCFFLTEIVWMCEKVFLFLWEKIS